MGNSFYGGQDARPFIIKNKFSSVAQMVEKFSLGLSYLDVNFEEYVLIDCQNKNNPENGMIFRRGYDVNSGREISYYKEERSSGDIPIVVGFKEDKTLAYGAEYIGNIVGPSGQAPLVKLQAGLITEDQRNSIYETLGDDIIEGTNVSYNELEFKKDNNSMVSGEGTDTISWNHLCTKTKENNETKMLIGFKIPYPVFKMSAEHVSAYNDKENEDGSLKNFSSEDLLSDSAPDRIYFKDWKLKIPKGIKGDSTKIELTGTTEKNDQQIKITNTTYDSNINGISEDITLNYNVIDNISFSEEGFFTIGMTAQEDFINEKPILWLNNISLENNGDVIAKYNNNEVKPDNTLNTLTWLTNASLGNDGELKFEFNNNKISGINKTLTWLTNASLGNDGALNFTFNNNTINPINQTLTWITGINFDENGKFTIDFNNNKIANGQFTNSNNLINWITDSSISEDGLLKITFNNNQIETGNKDSEGRSVLEKQLNWIKSASMSDTGLLKIDFVNNNGITANDSSSPNSIIQQITSLSNIYLDESGKFGYKLNTDDEASIQIPIIKSANITNGILTLGFKDGDSITATGSLKQINTITHDTQSKKLNFTYNDETVDQIDFPQNFYVSNINNEPSNVPSGSLWAIIESKGGN